MNSNLTDWSTFIRPDGLCNLLNRSGDVIGTFTDWQVAEFVCNMRNELTANAEIIAGLEDKIVDLEEDIKVTEFDYQDAKEQTENDHRTIVDLENEVDVLKTKLWNLTNE